MGEHSEGSAAGLSFEVTGSGPTLVLVHGGSGRRQWFTTAHEHLGDSWRCVAVDLPGHGGSRWMTGAYSLDDTAAVLADALAEVLDGPAVVFGHSHGAHVVARVMASRPELLRAFIIGDAPMTRTRMHEHHAQNRTMTERWMTLARSSDPDTVYDGLFATAAGPSGTSLGEMFGDRHPYLVEMAQSLAAHDPDFIDAVLNRFDDTYATLDPRDLGSHRAIPLGVLRADPDAGGLLTDADLAAITRVRPDCVVAELPNVGHGLQLQAPRDVARALTRVGSVLAAGA
ncbi:alpha/beta fold hydrolase [Gordonia sp. NPDC127522]|uniref:alpha/beta fold hydrolase n=1 Tax=Gordonia sp. NPDC127522 TaxID=3345390 RepID=UPI003638F881